MKTHISVKLLVLVLLGCFTSVVTSALLARRQVAARTLEDPQNGEVTVESDDLDEPHLRARPQSSPMAPYMVARFRMADMDATVQGQDVIVRARAVIRDRRPDATYIWGLRVHNGFALGKVAFEHIYADQRFTKTGIDASPTLTEHVELLPGTYQVEAILYTVPRDFDLRGLNDSEIEKSSRVATRVTKVQIAH